MLLDRNKMKKRLALKDRPFRPEIHPMLTELFLEGKGQLDKVRLEMAQLARLVEMVRLFLEMVRLFLEMVRLFLEMVQLEEMELRLVEMVLSQSLLTQMALNQPYLLTTMAAYFSKTHLPSTF